MNLDHEFSAIEPRSIFCYQERLQQLQLSYQYSAGDPAAQANYSSQIKAILTRLGCA